MSEKSTTIVVEQETPNRKSKNTYVKDSGSRIKAIAESHGLDAQLNSETKKINLIDRAIKREHKQKEQRQRNLERIIQFGFNACHEETAGDPDQDWLFRFFELAQDIHNSSMQKLWAQVLKREVTNPGSTSLKALKVLKDMTPREAQILQRAASLACSFGQDTQRKLFIGLRSQNGFFSLGKRETTMALNLGSFQLPYSSIMVLIELGLLHATELESGEIEISTPLHLQYQGKNLSLSASSKGVRILYYRFTPTGNELCRLLGNKLSQDYYDQLIALLNQKFSLHSDSSDNFHHVV
ncbi:TIGR03899 family protein [Vibrio sp.]|uniref:TIGR03899 family protein n=1 Tax=Vibrio viridaestus TaxID=2487322 RepID=A0A3N9TDI8_9VIBR|nr:TIGR03899 family protein [Vibrio viridaestus]MDC0611272.1 TIGR03899 family protein [Vibrio sp.]RQW61585.1 TIGR03899 family protein [Vibrio viridaestus]